MLWVLLLVLLHLLGLAGAHTAPVERPDCPGAVWDALVVELLLMPSASWPAARVCWREVALDVDEVRVLWQKAPATGSSRLPACSLTLWTLLPVTVSATCSDHWQRTALLVADVAADRAGVGQAQRFWIHRFKCCCKARVCQTPACMYVAWPFSWAGCLQLHQVIRRFMQDR